MKDEYKEMVCRVRFIDGVPAQTYLSDVEIVRCKDCVYYRPYSGGNGRYDCDNLYGMADAYEDGFCSRAERREE